MLADDAKIKLQCFSNRADMLGGSTLGSISNTRVSIATVDIGLPQLAMHSAVETAAVYDAEETRSALTRFYSSKIEKQGEKIIVK